MTHKSTPHIEAESFINTPSPLGVSSTVYSIVWPETEAQMRQALAQDTETLLDRHRQPWLKNQDKMHLSFFSAYEKFSAPAIEGGVNAFKNFPYFYPTAGASEAIRESIHQLGTQEQKPTLIVFEGEYEGYEAMGKIDGLPIIKIRRNHWKEDLEAIPQNLKGSFFLSHPSAIDGCEWDSLPLFLDEIQRHHPQLDVRLDLTYIGATGPINPIQIDHPVVSQLFFSLSKPFGSYYRRIGGCYATQEIPSLWGNAWFKNLDALEFGERLLTTEKSPFSKHLQWGDLQLAAVEQANGLLKKTLSLFDATIVPADVLLIGLLEFKSESGRQAFENARLDPQAPGHDLARLAARGSSTLDSASQRLCLSPLMETLLTHDPRLIASPHATKSSLASESPEVSTSLNRKAKPF